MNARRNSFEIKSDKTMDFIRASLFIFIAVVFTSITFVSSITENDTDGSRLTDCELVQPELDDQLRSITDEFGNVFEEVEEEINRLESKKGNDFVDALILIGNTGSGKSTLAQLISGNNTNIQSVEVTPNSGDFIISDNNKIGTDTLDSKTLYPNLLMDSETGIYICDSPGFKDTRSPIHELIAASSMKMVLKHVRNVKLVLVVTHSSLKKGSYRADFTNLLKQTIDFVREVEKYKYSFYLIGTKAENNYMLINGEYNLIPDKTVIDEIYHFLNETKSTLETTSTPAYILIKNKLIKIIEYLMEKSSDGSPMRINIFRKPFEEGYLDRLEEIQEERTSIRNVLLQNEHFTVKNDEDFGYSVSDTAKLYVDKITDFSEKYMNAITKGVSKYFTEHYKNVLNNIFDVDNRIKILNRAKAEIIKLETNVGNCRNPSEFVSTISEFSRSQNIEYRDCNLNFRKVLLLNNYLKYLAHFSNISRNMNKEWSVSIKPVVQFIHVETENCYLLKNIYSVLLSYDFQRNKSIFAVKLDELDLKNGIQNIINKNDSMSFLKMLSLDGTYNDLELNNYTIDMLSRAVNTLVRSDIKIDCKTFDKTLIVEGFIIKLSDIDFDSYFRKCYGVKNIVIFAMNTLFIDKDLDQEELQGKQIVIVARTWHTVGSRRISVNGESNKRSEHWKADIGEIGRNGMSGGRGGTVIGIGEKFVNGYNLFISANGGDGQDGQDGGDGLDGMDGEDGVYFSEGLSGNSKGIYIVYNTFKDVRVYEGTPGSPGGNSGAGGKGGHPGVRGTVNIYGIEDVSDSDTGSAVISIEVKDGLRGRNGADGKPGIGGTGGCDLVHTVEEKYYLFFPRKYTDISRGDCYGKRRDGYVRPNVYTVWPEFSDTNIKVMDKCLVMSNFKNIYNSKYKDTRFDETVIEFIKKNEC